MCNKIIYVLLFLSILFLSACGDNPEYLVTGTVISVGNGSNSQTVGFSMYIENGHGKGAIYPFAVGPEGAGYGPCDQIVVYCDDGRDRCNGREIKSKFSGSYEECVASLKERGILK